MSDLISRQAVLELTEHLYVDFANSFDLHTLTEIYRRVEELPSVENKGEWIFDGFCGNFGYDDHCKCHCSNCNKKIIVDGVYDVGKGYRIPEGITPNFCSNCGVEMKGVKNGEIE